MGDDLAVRVAGRNVGDGGTVEAVVEYGSTLFLDVHIRNLTDMEIADLRVLSNLPDGSWTVDGPGTIVPHGEAKCVMSVDAAALYDAPATLKRIAVDLEYTKVRRFG